MTSLEIPRKQSNETEEMSTAPSHPLNRMFKSITYRYVTVLTLGSRKGKASSICLFPRSLGRVLTTPEIASSALCYTHLDVSEGADHPGVKRKGTYPKRKVLIVRGLRG